MLRCDIAWAPNAKPAYQLLSILKNLQRHQSKLQTNLDKTFWTDRRLHVKCFRMTSLLNGMDSLTSLRCWAQKQLEDDVLGSGPSEELKPRSKRERICNNQRRHRARQKKRQEEIDGKITQLTAELEASRLKQVFLPPLLAGTSVPALGLFSCSRGYRSFCGSASASSRNPCLQHLDNCTSSNCCCTAYDQSLHGENSGVPVWVPMALWLGSDGLTALFSLSM